MSAESDLVRQVYAASGAGDWARVETFMADDLVITEAPGLPYAGQWHGRGALHELFTLVMAGWADPAVEHHALTGGDGHAVAVLTLHVTSRRTGDRHAFPILEMFRVEDGKVVEIKPFYFDTAAVAAAF